jgi:hypothetical protein
MFNRKTDDSLLVFQNNIITRKPTVNKNENLDTPVQKEKCTVTYVYIVTFNLGCLLFHQFALQISVAQCNGQNVMDWDLDMQTSIYCQGQPWSTRSSFLQICH